MGQAIGSGIERRRRPRRPNPTGGQRRLIAIGFVLTVLLGLAALASTYVATQIVNNVSYESEVARAHAAVAALEADGVAPGVDMVARLGQDFLLRNARVTTLDGLAPREANVPLGGGQVLAWMPQYMGDEMVGQLAPMRLLASALFIGAIMFVLYRLYRLTVQLEGLRRDARDAADRDALTDAASRLAFEDRLRAAFRDGTPDHLALLYLDLDDFKAVNDSLGHTAGDALLREVARRLNASARPGDLVARLGGDEFAIIRQDCGSRQELAAEAAELSRRLLLPYQLGSAERAVAVSIGIAIAPDDAVTAEALVRAADRALYSVKGDRSRAYAFASVPAQPLPSVVRPHAA